MKTSYNIAVLPGDGIVVEVMAVCLKLLEHLQKQSNEFQLKLKQYPAGAAHYRDVGDALPQGTWRHVATLTLSFLVRWACPKYVIQTEPRLVN